jgi:ribosomal protein S19
MTRSSKKIVIANPILFKRIVTKDFDKLDDLLQEKFLNNISSKLKKRLKTKEFLLCKTKNFSILPYMVGLRFLLYNGHKYFLVLIRQKMVGFKIGEFLLTKSLGFKIHLENRKQNKKIKN